MPIFNDKTVMFSFCENCPLLFVRVRLVNETSVDEGHREKEFDLECGHVRGCSRAYAAALNQRGASDGHDR